VTDRGFIDYAPRNKEVKARLSMMQEIIAEYRDELPLTMRQIFYRAVASYGYEKTEAAYKRLLYISRKARRGGLIHFADIRDDGVIKDAPFGFEGINDFKSYLAGVAKRYCLNRQIGQPRRLIVLCEAGGMVPQLARVCGGYGVTVQSAGGYDGVNVKHDLAAWACEQPTTILHIGDLDPSGEDMFTVIKEDVGAFVSDMAIEDHGEARGRWIVGNVDVEAVRVAATREQAIAMNLPTAPAKDTDSRTKNFKGLGDDSKGTVQCEAIPPDQLRDIVREAIEARIDRGAFEQNLAREETERQRAIDIIASADWGSLQ
jgi:hypothetical protein